MPYVTRRARALRMRPQHQALYCEVADDGAPQAVGAGARNAALWRSVDSHGLWMARQVADRLSLHSGPRGTTAAVSFALGPPGQPPFRLDRHSQRGCTILVITGQLDLRSASQLTGSIDNIAATPNLRLVMDLAGVALWDSSGLAALITSQQRISSHPPAKMILAGLPGHLIQHLRDTGLAGRFVLADIIADAIRELSPPR
jgi:anti-anti-sigma factor